MYRLPDLEPWCEQRCWLSSSGASELACQLLDEPGEPRRVRWIALLRLEPGLVLWAAAGLRWRLDGPPRLDELSQWLEQSAAAALDPRHDRQQPLESDQQGRLARQSGGSVAVARAVAMLGGGSGAQVSALLREFASPTAPPWLVACGDAAPLPVRLEAAAQRLAGSSATLPEDAAAVLRQARRDIGRRWMAVERPLPLGRLARTARRCRELEERFQPQLQEEKLASLKELAYGASHELNNPLANITTRAQALLRDEQDPERQRRLAAIAAQAFRAHEMISDMMLFAKPPRIELESCDLTALAAGVLDEMRKAPECLEAELSLERPDGAVVGEADPRQIAEALRALVRNSLEATGGEGRVRVRVAGGPDGPRLEVEDSGPGLSSRERRHLFDPFFSGREAGRGLGLGLAKAWTIVRAHGGQIEVPDGLPMRVVVRL